MWWWPCLKIFTSVPQVEQLRTRIFTSPGPGAGLRRVLDADVAGGVEPGHLHVIVSSDVSAAGRPRRRRSPPAAPGACSGSSRISASCGQDRRRARRPRRRCRRRRVTCVAVPVDAVGEAEHREGVAPDRLLAGQGAVRDGDALARRTSRSTLPLEHRLDVRRSTAPTSTRTSPHWRIASSRSSARCVEPDRPRGRAGRRASSAIDGRRRS